jgi:hypothetical protein
LLRHVIGAVAPLYGFPVWRLDGVTP